MLLAPQKPRCLTEVVGTTAFVQMSLVSWVHRGIELRTPSSRWRFQALTLDGRAKGGIRVSLVVEF